MDEIRISGDKYLGEIIEHLPDPTFVINLSGQVIAWNKAIAEMTQVKPEDMLGKGDYEYALPFYGERIPVLIDYAIRSDIDVNGRYDYIKKENDTLIAEVHIPKFRSKGIYLWSKASPLYDADHKVAGSIQVIRDITERKLMESELRNSEERYRAIFENSGTAIVVVGEDLNILMTNAELLKIAFYSPEEIIGKSLADFVVKEDLDRVVEYHKNRLIHPSLAPSKYECRLLDKKGNIRHVILTASIIPGTKKTIASIVDITERKTTEDKIDQLNKDLVKSNKRLKKMALCDPYTGLYNFHYLQDIIEAELFRAKRYAHSLSLIMLDIDYFKSINDVYGHEFGDLVLKQFAQLLKSLLRKYDIVIRFGGEEFIILSPGLNRAAAILLSNRLLNAINLYNFGDKKQIVKIKLSMSVVSYPEDKISAGRDLITIADQVLNKVKESGGNSAFTSLDIVKGKSSAADLKVKKTVDVEVLEEKIEKLTRRSNQSLIEAVFAFAKTIELKDHYTGEHVEKTVHYAVEVARAMGLSREEVEKIHQAAMLHDLGKIGISEGILLKPAKLTKKEFVEIKKHPQIAVDIIRPIQFLHSVIPFILYHHERWDGKGYPNGLKGEEIPLGARIIAIADVFQALISHRPYRKQAFSKKDAVSIIEQASGTQFDPSIVRIFSKVIQNID